MSVPTPAAAAPTLAAPAGPADVSLATTISNAVSAALREHLPHPTPPSYLLRLFQPGAERQVERLEWPIIPPIGASLLIHQPRSAGHPEPRPAWIRYRVLGLEIMDDEDGGPLSCEVTVEELERGDPHR